MTSLLSFVSNPEETDDVDLSPFAKRRDSQFAKRSRTKCGPNVVSTASRMRSITVEFAFVGLSRNASDLAKRMELPRRSMALFYGREFPDIENIILSTTGTSPLDMNTAVMRSFSDVLPGNQYSTGLEGLGGCTSLFVVSRKGVYATHWWENISFSPDPRWRTATLRTDDQLFQATVIDLLNNGGNNHPRLDASLLEDDSIRAYLIHPTQTWEQKGDSDVGYPNQWQQIRDTVGAIIPTLQDQTRWTDIPYVVLTGENAQLVSSTYAGGKGLFKYDPAHVLPNGQTVHMAALWVEANTTPYHDDKW